MASRNLKLATRKIIVYGGRGALGSACVNHFKASNSWVTSIDLVRNEQADANIIVPKGASCVEQEQHVMENLTNILGSQKVNAVICVAGGWFHEKTPSISKQADSMWRQSVCPSSIAASVASKYLMPGGLLALTGAKIALKATPGTVGYGMAKAAVHHLTKSLSANDFGLAKNSLTVAILPELLDTEMNRKCLPKADFSSWTPLSFVAQLFMNWTKGFDRPPNGSLVILTTRNNVTQLTLEEQSSHRVKYQIKG